jgi:outer membrane protein assembly factor BamB
MKLQHPMAALLMTGIFAASAGASDWPGFRGPGGLGLSADKNLPTKWSDKDNLAWKIKLPGPGSSSPIVWGNKVFVTCYSGYGVSKGGDPEKLRRHLLCLDRKDGFIIWNKDIAAKLPEQAYTGFMLEHGYASSTPITDGQRIYVFFGKTGVFAFDFDGKQLWQADVGGGTDKWGSATSPVLWKDLVIVNAAVESGCLIAINKDSGKEVWRTPGVETCWTSPLVVDLGGGKQEIVVNQPGGIVGYNPAKGDKLWHCEGLGTKWPCSSPVAKGDLVYYGYAGPGVTPAMVAVRAGGKGDVSKTNVVWRQKVAPNIASPVLFGENLYWVNGSVFCLKAKSGDIVYQERLYDTKFAGEYVSVVAGDGKVFALTRDKGLWVLAAAGKFEKLAHNQLDDDSIFNGSPAISDGQIFLRSNAFLYCIGKK